MLYSENTTTKYGGKQIKFYLTQGDTANFTAVPKKSDGSTVDLSIIEKCMFKLSDDAYKEVFQKEFTKNENGFFEIRLESEETAKIPVGDYIYEIEYTFTDGTVNTPNQSQFSILDQIIQ
jgi:hypothetical protein|nr:MAG TPA: hypothetical protein [Caudoviricetes sp.]